MESGDLGLLRLRPGRWGVYHQYFAMIFTIHGCVGRALMVFHAIQSSKYVLLPQCWYAVAHTRGTRCLSVLGPRLHSTPISYSARARCRTHTRDPVCRSCTLHLFRTSTLSHTHEGPCLLVLQHSAHKHTTKYLHLQRGWNKRTLELVEQLPRSRSQMHGATSR